MSRITKYRHWIIHHDIPQCVIYDLTIPPGFIEAIKKKDGIDMDIFGEPAYNYYDGENPFTDAYKTFYGEDKEEEAQMLVIDDYVRDTYNYYGSDNLPASIESYQRFFNDLCTINGICAKFALNDTMAEEAAQTKASREKTKNSKPLWNALKY